MATKAQIDSAFRQAGYTFGRPTFSTVPNAVFPYDYNRIVELFSSDVVNRILSELGENPESAAASTTVGFEYLMAAKILETIAASGYTHDGRNLGLTSTAVGGITSSFEAADAYISTLRNRIQLLNSQARKLGAQTKPFLEFLSGGGTAQGLDFEALKNTVVGGQGISILRDNENELIAINANPQNGRIILVNELSFTSTDSASKVIQFDTNIPANATDTDANIVKIFIRNGQFTDAAGSNELEFIVRYMQNADTNAGQYRVISRNISRDFRVWRTTWTDVLNNSFIRINVRRVKARNEDNYLRMFTVFAPSQVEPVGGNVLDGNILKGEKGDTGPAANADQLLPLPTERSADAGKIAALNSSGSAWELVEQSGSGGDGNRSEANSKAIQTLQNKTYDLKVGEFATGWADAVNVATQGGLAVREGAPFDTTTAAAATYSLSPVSPGGKYLVVRLPNDSEDQQARVILTSAAPNVFSYTLQVNAMHLLGSDDTWDYYIENLELGDHVASIKLQLTGDLNHIGTSVFTGIFDGSFFPRAIQADAIADFALSGRTLGLKAVDVKNLRDAVTDRLLPSRIGNANQIIRVNSDGDGVEYTNLPAASIPDNSITSGQLKSGIVTAAKLANDAVTSAKVATGAISDTKLATDSVTSAKIKDKAVSNSKLADGAITKEKISTGAVQNAAIGTAAISSAKLNSSLTKRLLPATLGTKGQVLTVNSAGTGVIYATPAAGGGSTTSSGGGFGIMDRFRVTSEASVNLNNANTFDYTFIKNDATTFDPSKPVFVNTEHDLINDSLFLFPNAVPAGYKVFYSREYSTNRGVQLWGYKGTIGGVANTFGIYASGYGGFTLSTSDARDIWVSILH